MRLAGGSATPPTERHGDLNNADDVRDRDEDDDTAFDVCRTDDCDGDPNDEGYDGFCRDCADERDEAGIYC